MVTSLPVTLVVGTVLGFLSGLGIGGGSLLILWLTLVLGEDPSTARSLNLLFFLPCALMACLIRIRSRTLKVKPLMPAILSGCLSAVIFSWISTVLDTELLKKIFGIILIIAGIRELIYKKRASSA